MYYGLGESFKHIIFLAYTKCFWPGARLVRMPIYARTKKNIHYGKGLTTGYACRFAAVADSRISIGENVIFGDYVQLQSSQEIVIGNNVLFASKIYVGDSNHGFYSGENQSNPLTAPNERPLNSGKIHIGNNVWIGNGVTIVGNVTIGDGTIIGANSVVCKDLDAFSIYAGVPARKIKEWDPIAMRWIPTTEKENETK